MEKVVGAEPDQGIEPKAGEGEAHRSVPGQLQLRRVSQLELRRMGMALSESCTSSQAQSAEAISGTT